MAEKSIDILLKAEDQASKVFAKVQGEADKLKKKVEGYGDSVENADKKTNSMGDTMKKVFGAAIVGKFIKDTFTMTSQIEQARNAFTLFSGSAEVAQKHLEDIGRFAAQTPFNRLGLIDASKRMQAFGFEIEKVIPMLGSIGDAVSAVGAGDEGLNRVIVALGQMQTKGKLVQQEVNQIAELGIPIFDILSEKLNLTQKQMGDIGNAGIHASKAIPLILEAFDERFGGLMEKQSKTLGGLLSNLLDNVQTVMIGIGESSLDSIKELVSGMSNLVQKYGSGVATIAGETLSQIFEVSKVILNDTKSVVSTILKEFGVTANSIGIEMNGVVGFFRTFIALTGSVAKAVIIIITGAAKAVIHAVSTVGKGAFDLVRGSVGSILNWVIKKANKVIEVINPILDIMGKKIQPIVGGFFDLGDAVGGLAGSGKGMIDIFNGIQNEVIKNEIDFQIRYMDIMRDATKGNSTLTEEVEKTKNKFSEFGNTAGSSLGSANKKTKEMDELLKKVQETQSKIRFDLMQKQIEKTKDTFKTMFGEVSDRTDKQKDKVKELQDKYNDLGKEIEDLGEKHLKELDKIGEATKKINDSINSLGQERGESLGDRYAEAKKELQELQRAFDSDPSKKTGENYEKIMQLQKEVAFGEANLTGEEINQAIARGEMTRIELMAQQFAQKKEELMQELADQELLKQITITKYDEEKIKLAEKQLLVQTQIADEQLRYESMVSVKAKLDNIYFKRYREHIDQQIVKTKELVTWLQKALSLSGAGSSGGGVETRANGGPVQAGRPYLVGEQGPEIIIPRSSGTVIPNNSMTTNVNFTGPISVRSDNDIKAIANMVSESLTRQMQTFKLGVS